MYGRMDCYNSGDAGVFFCMKFVGLIGTAAQCVTGSRVQENKIFSCDSFLVFIMTFVKTDLVSNLPKARVL